MERKVLSFDPHLCTGCMYCMTACSTYNEGMSGLSVARLRMIRHEGHALTRTQEKDELIFTLAGCRQCEDPVCSAVCPTGAITRDGSIGAMVIDREVCTGCRERMTSCPFGAIWFGEDSNGQTRAFKCELCKGDPLCVKFCHAQALQYGPAREEADPETESCAGKSADAATKEGIAFSDRAKKARTLPEGFAGSVAVIDLTEQKGHIQSTDAFFKAYGIDHRLWLGGDGVITKVFGRIFRSRSIL